MTLISPKDFTNIIQTSTNVVWITGAGLSVASGIAPYRADESAVWSNFTTEWGTLAKLKEDLPRWKEEFWYRTHPKNIDDIEPSAGHKAIARFVYDDPNSLVITQNIDGLHQKASTPKNQVIEIHGSHRFFSCHNEECTEHQVQTVFETDEPCPTCDTDVRPLVLLFDEDYNSHPIYQYKRAIDAISNATVLIFVGTSFAVGITNIAQLIGFGRKKRLINVNTTEKMYGFENLCGKCEDTLPEVERQYLEGKRK